MAPKWKDIAERNLEKGDEVERSYPAHFEGKYGHMLMSNRKLQFVREEGFLRKSYDLVLDLPYENIGEISKEGKYELDITDIEGKKYKFVTRDLAASIPEESLKELSE